MQPNIMRPVFAPLNDLFQEGAALQRRRRRFLLRNIIKNIWCLAFPESRSQIQSNAQIAWHLHEKSKHVELRIGQRFDVGCTKKNEQE
jgi:hypothetical protein